jgi:hypothetical protein
MCMAVLMWHCQIVLYQFTCTTIYLSLCVPFLRQGVHACLACMPILGCKPLVNATKVAVQNGLYGTDPEVDYEVDAACDAYQEWRNAWADQIGKGPSGYEIRKDGAEVEAYLKKRESFLGVMECHYRQRTSKASVYLCHGVLQATGMAHGLPSALAFGLRPPVVPRGLHAWGVRPQSFS